MKKLFLLLAAMQAVFLVHSQNTFQKSLGGIGDDEAFDVNATPINGGYIVAGSTNSFRASIQDLFFMKLDEYGDTAWVHTFGGDNVDQFEGRSAAEAPDGGYIIAGLVQGNGVGWNNRRIVIIKTQSDGETVDWANTYYLNDQDKEITGMDVRNNTIAITGYIWNGVGSGSGRDVYVMTVDINNPSATKVAVWNRANSNNEYPQDVLIDSQNNIVVTGYSEFSTNSSFLLKYNSTLNLQWAQNYDLTFGYNNRNYGYAVTESGTDYVIAGLTFYLSDRQTGVLNGYEGTMLLAASQNDGQISWANAYGVDGGYSKAHSISVDGSELIIGGETSGSGATDLYIMKTSLTGGVTWARATGGTSDDNAVGIAITPDNGYLAIGTTSSFSTGNKDIYVTKFNDQGGTKCNMRYIQNEERDIAGDFNLSGESVTGTYTASVTDIKPNLVFRKVYMPAACVCAEDPDFESSAPACSGQEVDFRITTGMDHLRAIQWIFNDDATVPANQDTATAPSGIVYTAGGLKEVTLTVNDGACSGSKTKIINIRQTPIINTVSASSTTICEDELIDFTSAVAAGSGQIAYAWDFGNGTTSAKANPADVDVQNGTAAAEVALTIENEYGCKTSDGVTITVNPMPEADFSATEARCTGQGVDFIYTGTLTPTSFVWNYGTNGSGTTSGANPTGVIFTESGEQMVSLTATLGSCSNTIEKPVTIHETPVIDIAAVAATCAKEAIDFSATVTPDASALEGQWTFNWDFGTDAQPAVMTAETPTGVSYATEGTKTASLTVIGEYCQATATEDFEILALPIPEVEEDFTICANRTATIGGADISGYQYEWYSSDMETIKARDLDEANPEVAPETGATTYWLTVTDANACVNYDTVTVYMKQAADVNAGPDLEICYGDTIQIGASFIEGQTYRWYVTDSMDNFMASSPLVWPTQTTDYLLASQFEDCDMVFDTVRVIVNQLPDVIAKDGNYQDTTEISIGESVQLIATGAIEYDWTPYYALDNNGIDDPIASPEETTMYTVEGMDVNGCINWDSVLVIVNTPQTWVPTSFTPNGDGMNDMFYVRARGVEKFLFQVYTRSGEKIFSTTDLSQGWDGKRQGTDYDLPVGAYVFYFEADFTDGQKESQKGVINLVR